MHVQPYLNFNGRCDEALTFYKKALGAEVETLMRFKDDPDPSMVTPGTEEKIMHSSFRVGDSVLMASDGRCAGGGASFQGISLTLNVADDAAAAKSFAALADGGQVHMPLTKTFFSSSFGMVADRFGVVWMLLAATK